MDAMVRKELDKVIVEMRCRKMEGKDPQEGGWSTETGLWPHLIPLEYQTYPAANK